jgi:hypothetical protein
VANGAGNPIAIASGNKYQMEVDLPALPGELGLEIVRHYNSAHARVLGPLGNGWRLSYETELYRIGQTLQVLQADGSRQTFSIDPQNPSHCTSDDPRAGHIHIGHTTTPKAKPCATTPGAGHTAPMPGANCTLTKQAACNTSWPPAVPHCS